MNTTIQKIILPVSSISVACGNLIIYPRSAFGYIRKFALVLVTLLATFFVFTTDTHATWYNSSYTYCRELIMTAGGNAGGVATTTTAGFPLVATSTIADLKSITHGGKVQVVTADKPLDVVFTSGTDCNSDGGALLDYYFESYASTTGAFVAWVQPLDIASTTAKSVLMYYGNAAGTDQQDKVGVWDAQNELAIYNLDEDPSTTAPQILDATANNLDTTSAGSMTTSDQVSGQVNGSLDFDGVNDYVMRANASSGSFNFTYTTPFSVCMWLKVSGAPAEFKYLANKRTSSGLFAGWLTGIQTTGKINFQLRQDGTHRFSANTTNTVTADTWEQWCTTYDATNDISGVKMYKNGVSETLTDTNNQALNGDPSNTADFSIGARDDGDFSLGGFLDDVRIYNSSLHAMDLKTIYNNTRSSAVFWTFGAEETEGGGAAASENRSSFLFKNRIIKFLGGRIRFK